jgi:hypothetical protein
MLIQQSFNISSFSLIFPSPFWKKVAVTGELSLDGTLLPVEKADIKYQVVNQGCVNTLILPLKNKNEIIESGLYDAPDVDAAYSMQELVKKIMLPLAPAHAMHRRGVNQPKPHGMYVHICGCVCSCLFVFLSSPLPFSLWVPVMSLWMHGAR